MATNVTITSAVGKSGVGHVVVAWDVSDPNVNGLPYLQYKETDIYVSATDDFGAASLDGTSADRSYMITGLVGVVTRYVWFIPRDKSDQEGARYPASNGLAVSTLSEITTTTITATDVDAANVTASGDVEATGDVQGNQVRGTRDVSDQGSTSVALTGAGTAHRVTHSGSGRGHYVGHSGTGDAILLALSGSADGLVITNSGSGDSLAIAGPSDFTGDVSVIGKLSATLTTGTTAAIAVTITGSANTPGATVSNSSTGTGHGVQSSRLGGGSGSYAFYAIATGSSGTYGPFTGAHDALLPRKSKGRASWMNYALGDVVCDVRIVAKSGISDTISEIELSSKPKQATALGVYLGCSLLRGDEKLAVFGGKPIGRAFADRWRIATVNSLGEGQINVCGEGGSIAAGDLLVTSSIPGKAMRQDDDVLRACTVARARESIDLSPGDVAQIACIYLCG